MCEVSASSENSGRSHDRVPRSADRSFMVKSLPLLFKVHNFRLFILQYALIFKMMVKSLLAENAQQRKLPNFNKS